MIIYTNWCIKKSMDALTVYGLTLMRPSKKLDSFLHAHEAKHREQFSKDKLLPLRCLFSKQYWLLMEVEAHHAEYMLDPTPARLLSTAKRLAERYHFKLDLIKAVHYIERGEL